MSREQWKKKGVQFHVKSPLKEPRRSLDKSRLKSKIAELSENDMASIEAAMKRFLNLT
jgi:mRNA-degrading endonuclease toxin of MazEF toxin-antitoxin module